MLYLKTLQLVRIYFDNLDQSGQTNSIKKDTQEYCFITIKPNQGGLESRDFCNILVRMLEKYANKKNIDFEYLENTEYITLMRVNTNAKVFKKLSGMHRLVRISPFGKGDKLHTSLCKVSITGPTKKFNIKIKESDVRMDFFKSTGPGGQHRNKVMSAVRLLHKPTSIMVTSSSSRSQHDNRRYAYEQLQCKLEEVWENQQKQNLIDYRIEQKANEEVVATYYFNHQFAINETDNKKTTTLKQLLNGDIKLIF